MLLNTSATAVKTPAENQSDGYKMFLVLEYDSALRRAYEIY